MNQISTEHLKKKYVEFQQAFEKSSNIARHKREGTPYGKFST